VNQNHVIQQLPFHTRTEHEGRPRGEIGVYLYSFCNFGIRLGWVVIATPRPLYPLERPGTHYIGGWVDPRSNVDRYGKSRPTGIRSLDCPAYSESLCWLCFASPLAIAFVLFELVLCDSALEILSLILSGVMAVLQVLIIFYIYSDHKPWHSRITNYELVPA